MPVMKDFVPHYSRSDPLGYLQCSFAIRLLKDYQKLFPAIADNKVAFPHLGGDYGRDIRQKLIACRVPEGIVVFLEIVEVEHHER